MFGPTFLLLARLTVGTIAAVLAVLGFGPFGWPTSLSVSVAIMAGFIIAQVTFSYLWARPSFAAPAPIAGEGPEANPWVETAKLSITTQGVVLGLVAFSDPQKLNVTVLVGAASLAAGVLVATSMYLVVLRVPPPPGARTRIASLLISVQLWTLGFGLICVVAGNWRT